MGISDNILTTLYFSSKCPIFIIPTMDLKMYKNKIILKNIKKLKLNGNYIIDSKKGNLMSGLKGQGRIIESKKIIKKIFFI